MSHLVNHHSHRWHGTEPVSERELIRHISENAAMIIDGTQYCHFVYSLEFQASEVSAAGPVASVIGRIDGPHGLLVDMVYSGDAVFSIHKGHSINQDLSGPDTRMGYFDGDLMQYSLTSGAHYRMLEYGFDNSPGKFGTYGVKNNEVFRHAYYQVYCVTPGTTSGEIGFEFFSD